jgi:hypothetical protein
MSVYRSPDPPPTLPRPLVRRPQAAGAIRWLARLFILPHVLVGLSFLATIVIAVSNPLFGTDTDAHITEERVSRIKSGYSYQVTYAYVHGGRQILGYRSFSLGGRSSPSDEERLSPGKIVPVRHIGVGALRHEELLLPGESAWKGVAPVLFMAAFWNGIVGVFVYTLWYLPWRNRNLLRWGTAVPGQITRLHTKTGKSTSYHADYTFTMPGGTVHEATMTVSTKELWETLAEGQPVTVLRSPGGPKPSVIHEASDYTWVSGL